MAGSLTKGAAAATKFLEDAVKFYARLGVVVQRAQTDNGTEFTSNAILAWADEAKVGWHYIAPDNGLSAPCQPIVRR